MREQRAQRRGLHRLVQNRHIARPRLVTDARSAVRRDQDRREFGAEPPSPQFKSVYPHMTLMEGNRFHFRGGDPHQISANLRQLFQNALPNADIKARVDDN